MSDLKIEFFKNGSWIFFSNLTGGFHLDKFI